MKLDAEKHLSHRRGGQVVVTVTEMDKTITLSGAKEDVSWTQTCIKSLRQLSESDNLTNNYFTGYCCGTILQ